MEKDKVVIPGVNGFVGQHLAKELHDAGMGVIGIDHSEINPDIADYVDEYYQADLTTKWPETSMPRAVINLAGLAAVDPSFGNPWLYYDTNVSIVDNLCKHYVDKPDKPRIVIVSSGAVYDSDQPMPINEDGKIGPTSPYADSKVQCDELVDGYRNRGLDCVVVRPFNHIGPGQTAGFLLPDLFDKLISLDPDKHKIITGDIETRRDYTDVRDVARAYGKIALAPSLKYNLYNICSGSSIQGVEIFTELKKTMGLPDVDYEIDTSHPRKTDYRDIVGNASRLRDELGWKPEIGIHETIQDFVAQRG